MFVKNTVRDNLKNEINNLDIILLFTNDIGFSKKL